MRTASLQEARREGELAAARELIRLNVDTTQIIDIFKIIEQERLWLIFQPLDNPLGTYIPGGILINSQRTLPIQRLTAAHEYGHHVLKHGASVDGEDNLGDPLAIKEVKEAAAQAFATDFLMPLKLVNSLWQRLSLPKSVDENHIYLLSLYMGTSYKATVYQLAAQEKITPTQGQRFLKVQPKGIKQRIGRGIGPQNSRAEIWPIERKDSGAMINLAPDDEIRLALPESPATGYLWSLEQGGARLPEDTEANSILGLVRSEFDIADRKLISEGTGGEGNRYITLRALKPGNVRLHLPLQRPWLKKSSPADEFILDVKVASREIGLPEKVKEALLTA